MQVGEIRRNGKGVQFLFDLLTENNGYATVVIHTIVIYDNCLWQIGHNIDKQRILILKFHQKVKNHHRSIKFLIITKRENSFKKVQQYRTKMPPVQDYKTLYEQKCLQFDQQSEQFNELQQQSTLIMNDLEDQIKELKRKNDLLERQVKDLKEKKKYITSTIERELDQAQKQKNQFKNKFKDFEKKVISLQIINEDLQNELRATKSTLEEYQASAEKTMEELAILRVELEESTSSNQEQIARLMQQLKETEQQITIMHQKGKASESHPIGQQNPNDNISQHGTLKQKAIETPTSVKRAQSNYGQNQVVQQGHKKDMFKQTIRQMRDYMQSIDVKMQERRKAILNQREFLTAINSS